MKPEGTRVFTPASEEQRRQLSVANTMPDAPALPARQRTLSHSRVSDMVAELIGQRFYGKLALHFEAGHIVCAKLEQSIKE